MHGSGGSSGSRQRWDGGWRDNWEENRRKQGTPSHAAADARSKKLLEKLQSAQVGCGNQRRETDKKSSAPAGRGASLQGGGKAAGSAADGGAGAVPDCRGRGRCHQMYAQILRGVSTEAWRVSNLLEVKQLLTQKAFRILCRCEGLTACHGGHPPCGGPECADQGGQQRSWVAFAQKQAFALVEESMSLEEESMRSKLLNVEAVTASCLLFTHSTHSEPGCSGAAASRDSGGRLGSREESPVETAALQEREGFDSAIKARDTDIGALEAGN